MNNEPVRVTSPFEITEDERLRLSKEYLEQNTKKIQELKHLSPKELERYGDY